MKTLHFREQTQKKKKIASNRYRIPIQTQLNLKKNALKTKKHFK